MAADQRHTLVAQRLDTIVIDGFVKAHALLPRPDGVGRSVRMPVKS
jgi:hypothetical protein